MHLSLRGLLCVPTVLPHCALLRRCCAALLQMSKKVAQLTKVIYLLNTKNDEHAFEVSCLQYTYEEDVEAVLRDAQAKMAALKDRLEAKTTAEASAAGGSAAKALDELRRAHDTDKKAAQAKMAQLREQSLANENTIKNASKDRIDALKKEVEDAKTQVRHASSTVHWKRCLVVDMQTKQQLLTTTRFVLLPSVQFLLRMASFSRVSKAMEAAHATALLEQKNKALKEMEDYVKAVRMLQQAKCAHELTHDLQTEGQPLTLRLDVCVHALLLLLLTFFCV